MVVILAATVREFPRLSALAFIVRVAKHDGLLARIARRTAGTVERGGVVDIESRHGPVPTRLYRPARPARRTTIAPTLTKLSGSRNTSVSLPSLMIR